MADVATLGLAVDSSQVAKGSVALEKLKTSAMGAEAAAVKLAGGAKQVAGAAEAEARSLTTATAATMAHARSAQVHGSAVKLSNQQLGQMQFQLQDIAVGLASGQSPFMVLTQQGSQLAQSFTSGTGVLAALRAVGTGIGAFVTNPLNLAVLGFAAAAGAASLLWNAISGSEGASAEEALERHEDLIERIKERYGEAAVAAIDYARDSETALNFDASRNTEAMAAALRTQQAQLARDLQTTFLSFTDPFSGTMVESGLEELSNLTNKFIADVAQGKGDVQAFTDEVSRIGQAADAGSVIRDVASEIRDLAKTVIDAEAVFRQAQGLQTLVGGNPGRTSENASMDSYRELIRTGQMMSTEAAAASRVAVAAREAEEQATKAALQVGKQATDEAAREREAVGQLIESLQFQNELFGQSAEAREVLVALQKAGSAATDEEAAKIVALVQRNRELDAARDATVETLDTIRGTAKGMLSVFDQGIRSGQGFFDSLTAAATRLEDKLFDLLENQFIGMLFGERGSAGGGFLSAIFGSLFGGGGGTTVSGLPTWGGPHAAGGLVSGRGSSTSDSIPAMLSNGEFVVNAHSTSMFKPLLDMINGGAARFASGGIVRERPPDILVGRPQGVGAILQ